MNTEIESKTRERVEKIVVDDSSLTVAGSKALLGQSTRRKHQPLLLAA